MPARFPRLRPDGSFCVEVVFVLEGAGIDNLASKLEVWLQEWVAHNRFWNFSGQRDWFEDFTAVPQVSGVSEHALYLRLHGKPGSKWWRDWLALRLRGELEAAFPMVRRLVSIKDCPDE